MAPCSSSGERSTSTVCHSVGVKEALPAAMTEVSLSSCFVSPSCPSLSLSRGRKEKEKRTRTRRGMCWAEKKGRFLEKLEKEGQRKRKPSWKKPCRDTPSGAGRRYGRLPVASFHFFLLPHKDYGQPACVGSSYSYLQSCPPPS